MAALIRNILRYFRNLRHREEDTVFARHLSREQKLRSDMTQRCRCLDKRMW